MVNETTTTTTTKQRRQRRSNSASSCLLALNCAARKASIRNEASAEREANFPLSITTVGSNHRTKTNRDWVYNYNESTNNNSIQSMESGEMELVLTLSRELEPIQEISIAELDEMISESSGDFDDVETHHQDKKLLSTSSSALEDEGNARIGIRPYDPSPPLLSPLIDQKRVHELKQIVKNLDANNYSYGRNDSSYQKSKDGYSSAADTATSEESDPELHSLDSPSTLSATYDDVDDDDGMAGLALSERLRKVQLTLDSILEGLDAQDNRVTQRNDGNNIESATELIGQCVKEVESENDTEQDAARTCINSQNPIDAIQQLESKVAKASQLFESQTAYNTSIKEMPETSNKQTVRQGAPGQTDRLDGLINSSSGFNSGSGSLSNFVKNSPSHQQNHTPGKEMDQSFSFSDASFSENPANNVAHHPFFWRSHPKVDCQRQESNMLNLKLSEEQRLATSDESSQECALTRPSPPLLVPPSQTMQMRHFRDPLQSIERPIPIPPPEAHARREGERFHSFTPHEQKPDASFISSANPKGKSAEKTTPDVKSDTIPILSVRALAAKFESKSTSQTAATKNIPERYDSDENNSSQRLLPGKLSYISSPKYATSKALDETNTANSWKHTTNKALYESNTVHSSEHNAPTSLDQRKTAIATSAEQLQLNNGLPPGDRIAHGRLPSPTTIDSFLVRNPYSPGQRKDGEVLSQPERVPSNVLHRTPTEKQKPNQDLSRGDGIALYRLPSPTTDDGFLVRKTFYPEQQLDGDMHSQTARTPTTFYTMASCKVGQPGDPNRPVYEPQTTPTTVDTSDSRDLHISSSSDDDDDDDEESNLGIYVDPDAMREALRNRGSYCSVGSSRRLRWMNNSPALSYNDNITESTDASKVSWVSARPTSSDANNTELNRKNDIFDDAFSASEQEDAWVVFSDDVFG